MKAVAAFGCLVALLALSANAAAQSEVRERAFEEAIPGIFVRGGAAVVMDVEPDRCAPACGAGQTCEQVCDETPCDPSEGPVARCNSCTWQCGE
jgi:hypothetical protein